MQTRFLLSLLLLFVGSLSMEASAQETNEALHKLFDDYWAEQLEDNPLMATSVGVHDFNDRLPEVTVAAYARRLDAAQGYLERLEAIDRANLNRDDQISYDIFERLLSDRIQGLSFRDYYLPITSRSGFHVSFPQLGERMPFNSAGDYENYIARLNAFQTYAEQHIELMREGIGEGFTLPRVVLEGYVDVISPHIVDDPTESRLWEPFDDFPEVVSSDKRERLREAGRQAIAQSVVPGYQAFLDFMRDEYVPSCRSSIAASDLPNGQAYYEHRVRLYTTLDDTTPERVHQIGLDEVARIRAEMEDVIRESGYRHGVAEGEAGFDSSFDTFVEFLRTDPQFYADSPEELMRHVAAVGKRVDGELPGLFKTLPRMPWGIKKVPDFIAPRTTTAYYQRPAGDGTRAGYYYVNTYNLPERPFYEIEALSLHEAVPGHHLQIALQQEIEDVPDFRRFAGFTAFVEGWALYAERLGLEMGFYEDPHSNFGRLTYEMWRALRLVVDTGMHAKGWTRQEAIDFMAENSALTLHNITTEVDRYISWPGQALAYKTGELKIRELRSHAEEALGEAFDVREFHDVVLLSGAVPLSVLEENVERWTEDRRGRE